MKRPLTIITIACGILLAFNSCDSSNVLTAPSNGNNKPNNPTATYTVTLSVQPSNGGTVSISPDQKKYKAGTKVNITAHPSKGWRFVKWKGDHSGTSASATITVKSDMKITGVFTKKQYPLIVKIEGHGTVDETVISPKTTKYKYGTKVRLTAYPDHGWRFAKWTGDITNSNDTLTLTVKQAMKVKAVFNPQPKLTLTPTSLTVKAGSGKTRLTIKNTGPNSSTLKWQISSKTGWLSVKPSSGTGKTTVKVKYKKAATGRKRTAMIYITSNGGDKKLQITQKRADFYLAASDTTIICTEASFGETGTVQGVTYTKRKVDQITTANAAQTCTSGITDMSYLFINKGNFNKDISSWDVSNVTDMDHLFFNAKSFNQPIGQWDVSKVTDMRYMFARAHSFNQPIGQWDVSNVTTMRGMFSQTKSFNQPIGSWDVSNVTDMHLMFAGTHSFNQPLGNWNVSNVENMWGMFRGAQVFNQDLSKWNVSSVTKMSSMFQDAKNFDQDLSSWCVPHISSKPADFAAGSGLDPKDMPDWAPCTP